MITMSNHNPNKRPEASAEARKAAIAASVAKGRGQAPPGSLQERREQATASGVVKPARPDRPTKIPADKNLVGAKKPDEADAQRGADSELDKAVTKPKRERDENMLTVGDVAREVGVDPKRARARLRASGEGAVEGRWPKVRRGSDEHRALIAKIKPDDEKPTSDGEKA